MKVNFENELLTPYRRSIVLNEIEAIQNVQGHPNIIKVQNVFKRGTIYFYNKDNKNEE